MQVLPTGPRWGVFAAAWAILLLAQPALAQHSHHGHDHDGNEGEMVLVGHLSVGFGQLREEHDEETQRELLGIGDAAVFVSGTKGPFVGRLEIGVHSHAHGEEEHGDEHEAEEPTASVTHDIRWKLHEHVHIVLTGSAMHDSVPSLLGNTQVTSAPDGPVGNLHQNFIDTEEMGLANIEFPIGATTFGLALVAGCVPSSCGYGIGDEDGEASTVYPEEELATLVPHLRGEVGNLRYNAYVASSQGKFHETESTGTAQIMGGGAHYDGRLWTVGADVANGTAVCDDELMGPAGEVCSDDLTVSAVAVSATLGGFGVRYYSGETKIGDDKETETSIDVVYLFAINDVVVGPEYRQLTVSHDDEEETASLLLFGMAMEF